MRRAGASTLVLALAAMALGGCGKKHGAPAKERPAPAVASGPVAPPPPRHLPTYIRMDEIDGHTPSGGGVRMVEPVALDPSGKQGIGKGCVTAANVKVAMHQVADAYGVARWNIRTRQTSANDTRGEFLGDFEVNDGTLHVRGALAAAPACNPGEVGLTLWFTKAVEAPPVAPPAPEPPGGLMMRGPRQPIMPARPAPAAPPTP
ncbi:MAG TPA: hypothetical protein VHE35_35375 [Kofleriaceae bacterium]|nr:hypothetical protein [Kofleriaceae bacterium]